jgi:SAM-dependent methyltransferase
MTIKHEKNHYYGILADWYDKLLISENKDINYYVDLVSRRGGNALELACGTGRLLLPIIQREIEIDGVDISPEMLSICKQKLMQEGISTNLYEDDIVKFQTNKKYNTIFISGGSFCMIESIDDALQCLYHVYNHLADDGLFVLDIFNPIEDITRGLDGVQRLIRTAESGEHKMLCFSSIFYDTQEQLMAGTYKYELYKNNVLEQTLNDDFKMRWYGQYEFLLMLQKVGFKKIEAQPASVMSSHQGTIIFHAYK